MVTSARSLNSTAKRGADQSTSASARMIFCFLCFLVALPDHFMQLCDRFVNPADLIDDPFFDGLFSDENGSEVLVSIPVSSISLRGVPFLHRNARK